MLDHILVSQDFVRSYPDHFGEVQYLQLFNDHLVDSTLSDSFGDYTESDHGQVEFFRFIFLIFSSTSRPLLRSLLTSSSSHVKTRPLRALLNAASLLESSRKAHLQARLVSLLLPGPLQRSSSNHPPPLHSQSSSTHEAA